MVDSSILGVKGTARVLANIIKEKYGTDIGDYEIS
jgi:hypothetical protein